MNFCIAVHKNLEMRKTYKNGEWVGYPKAKHFKFIEQECETVEDVYEMLVFLQSQPTTTITRAKFIGDEELNSQYKCERNTNGEEPTLMDYECNWGCIDVDGFPLPKGILEEEVPEYVLATKLSFLGDVDCVIQHSSKSGFDGFTDARLHVWIQLDRGVKGVDMQRWAVSVGVDPAVFRAAQVHYIQNPLFEGCEDPVKERFVLVKGSKQTYSPVIPPEEVYEPFSGAHKENGPEPWKRFLEMISRDNKHHYLTKAVCSYWQCRGDDCDWDRFKDEALGYCQQCGHPDARREIVYPEVDYLVKYAKGFKREVRAKRLPTNNNVI